MQKKVTRTVEEVINLCDSCGKEIDKSEIVSRCCMCYKDICQDCKSIISINSWTFFYMSRMQEVFNAAAIGG